jgi:demethylmenaquinone methyltransferase / 2-methoxy-6-polyprenyl-1,4-benzoquinol methylase
MSSNVPSDVADGASARKRQALELFRGLPRRYDLLSAALSFGQDPRWRRALVDAVAPRDGERVLDVANGTGMVAAELLARAGGCRVVGIDQSAEMLSAARARFAGRARVSGLEAGDEGAEARDGGAEARDGGAEAEGLEQGASVGGAGQVELIEGQAEHLPFADASFDALTFTYLLRYVDDPAATMCELARVVRPGGRVASLEFGVPPWPPARAAWRLYTRVGLPALGRLFSREWAEVGRFLGPSITGFYARHPLERIVACWREAGLEHVQVRRMSLGGGVVMSATKAMSATGSSPSAATASRAPAARGADAPPAVDVSRAPAARGADAPPAVDVSRAPAARGADAPSVVDVSRAQRATVSTAAADVFEAPTAGDAREA